MLKVGSGFLYLYITVQHTHTGHWLDLYHGALSEHCSVAFNLHRRPTRLGSFLFCDFSAALPGRTFQDLRKIELGRRELQTRANRISDTITEQT